MLLKKTEQLIEDLNIFKSLQVSSNESKDYIKRNDDLKIIVVYVEKLSEIVSLFRKQGFIIEIDSIINYPLELFKTLYKNWETDKTNIIQKNDFFRRVQWSTIETEIKSTLLKQWEDYIDSNKPSVNRETLNAFEQIPDFANIVSSIKEKLELLDEYKNSLPSGDNNFQLVISSSLEMKFLMEQLDSKDIPDSVSSFLKKAGTIGGIDLSEITTEIFEWLRENNLLDKCLVKFK